MEGETFRVTLNVDSGGPHLTFSHARTFSANFWTSDGKGANAAGTADYVDFHTVETGGQHKKRVGVNVTVRHDDLAEHREHFRVRARLVEGSSLSPESDIRTCTVTIIDDDSPVGIDTSDDDSAGEVFDAPLILGTLTEPFQTVRGSVHSNDDIRDGYVFTLARRSWVTFKFTDDAGTFASVIPDPDLASHGNPLTVELEAGTHRFVVYASESDDPQDQNYQLELWVDEVGGSLETATDVGTIRDASRTLADYINSVNDLKDYYRFELDRLSTVSVDFEMGRGHMSVRDHRGNRVPDGYLQRHSEKTLTLAPGTYYVEVESWTALLPIPYRITLGASTIHSEVEDVRIASTPLFGDGTYRRGEDIELDVTFTRPVEVHGNPVLGLNIGTTDNWRGAHYVRGSGQRKLRFRYTVQLGDLDTDGIGIRGSGVDSQGNYFGLVGAGSRILDVETGLAAKRDYDGVPRLASHKVDGSVLAPSVKLSLSSDTLLVGSGAVTATVTSVSGDPFETADEVTLYWGVTQVSPTGVVQGEGGVSALTLPVGQTSASLVLTVPDRRCPASRSAFATTAAMPRPGSVSTWAAALPGRTRRAGSRPKSPRGVW